MITLGKIEEIVKEMKRHQGEVGRLQGELDATITRITADATRHPAYIEEKVTEARGKATPAIYEALGRINALHESLVSDERFWRDKRFLLSTKPLTEALNSIPGAPAKDAGVEAMARIAKMTELSKLDAEQLHLAAENAKLEKQWGELHLITLENNGRDQKQPGWKAIDLSDVVLEDQEQALRLFGEARKMASGISLAMKTAEGKAVSPTDRINAERGNPPPFAGPRPAGSPQDRINAAREVR
ncbi:MAG TPA: hypothetical protein PK036_14695 [Geobacteraceae bacterium]|nr:hypothetical protein [Geobacteraceae bacterium]